MKKAPSKPITAKQRKELEALATLPDDKIDLREMPEIRDWSGARRGALYRPIKQQLTLRLDADVVAWFKAGAPRGGYQTAINRALREHVAARKKTSQRDGRRVLDLPENPPKPTPALMAAAGRRAARKRKRKARRG